MIKNLKVSYSNNYKIEMKVIHKVVFLLKKDFNFAIRSFSINLVSDKEIKEININYLDHHYTTDIITFNYSDDETIDGEIFISVDDAKNNASKYRVSLIKEIVRLTIHGFLHLLGYDDMNKKDKTRMKKMENDCLDRYCKILKIK